MKVYGIVGWKNAGKTGLMERLVAEITGRGFSVSTIKRAHHAVDVDQPGKDSYRHRQAGAHEVVLASKDRFAIMQELRGAPEPALEDLLARLTPVDLVLVEGFKNASHPKIEAYRRETGHLLIATDTPSIRAIATDAHIDTDRPVFDLNDTTAIADFILSETGLIAGTDAASGFDRIVMVDWSAQKDPTPRKPSSDAIWMAVWQSGQVRCTYHRTRALVMQAIVQECDDALRCGQRVLMGFDFPFGYPKGFSEVVAGSTYPLDLWAVIASHVQDSDTNANNRFDVARGFNRLFPGVGPFWGCPAGEADMDLSAKGTHRHGHGMQERRSVERLLPKSQPCWKLFTAGSVGSQALLGIARLEGLRARYSAAVSVAPFQDPNTPIVLAEIYPSMIDAEIEALREPDEIKDRAQVRVMAQAFAGVPAEDLEAMLREGDPQEGWILGLGHETTLRAALKP